MVLGCVINAECEAYMVNTIQDKMKEFFNFYSEEVAVEYGQAVITYKELNDISSSLSQKLLSREIKDYKIIGVLLKDKLDFIIAIISILKSGNIFMPLDTNLKDQRLKIMFDVVKPDHIITDSVNQHRVEEYIEKDKISIFDQNMECLPQEEGEIIWYDVNDPIYIFFTSGTTGYPKAIKGRNQSLLHFVEWERKFLKLQKGVKVSQLTSQGFDAILRDIFTTLSAGGTICIPEHREIILDADELGNWVEREEIEVIHCTPTLFRSINRKLYVGRYPKLKYVLMAGEKIVSQEFRRWYEIIGDRVQLINLYGPSETTMVKTYYEMKASDAFLRSIPIGKPIDGADIYIMDQNMKCCDDGCEGEICIATDDMTLGYINNDALNNEKFLTITLEDGKRIKIYRTDDYGKWNQQGELEYLGRKDRQVKIRGNRIELGEIENTLMRYDGITQCYVHCFDEEKERKEAHYCKRCGITDQYKEIIFDEEGICNICREYEQYRPLTDQYFKSLDELKEKLQSLPQSQYDCILLYSGGKDSTYVLYRLKEMGIRVFAFIFDNGYISKVAYENIKNAVNECNVDYIIANYKDMDDIFRAGIQKNGSVCEGCYKVLRTLSTTMAYQKNIRYVISGLSRGQIFDTKLYDIMKQNVTTVEEIEQKMFEQRCLYYANKEYAFQKLCNQYHIDKEVLEQVEWIDFYRYCDATKDEIMSYLKRVPKQWSLPMNTGACSTNCMINDVGIYMQRKMYGYDNYTFPDSWEVRLGHITLEQGLEATKNEIDVNRVHDTMSRFGGEESLSEIEQYVPKKYLIAYYVADKTIDRDKLVQYLRDRLTDAHLPSGFYRLDQMPMNLNGKIDVASLPKKINQVSQNYEAFEDIIELHLAGIWSDILGRDSFNRNDNFLSVGGQSLQVMTMISRISDLFHVVVPLEELFNNATISGISAYIRENMDFEEETIEEAEKKEYYPLTKQQFEIYMAEQTSDCKTLYVITSVIHMDGDIYLLRLQEALNQLISRNEILRTTFDFLEGQPVQRVHDTMPIQLHVLETSVEDTNKKIKECIQAFDLATGPLFQVSILKTPEHDTKLVLTTHHIITDGISIRILIHELNDLYNEHTLEPKPLQYKDYSVWENNLKIDFMEYESYWTNVFSTNPTNSRFPVENEAKMSDVYAGDDYDVMIDQNLIKKLNKLAVEDNVTLFAVLFSSFHILYGNYAGSEDVTIGTPIDMRNISSLTDMVGDFAYATAIRSYPIATLEFEEYLKSFQSELIQAMKYAKYSVVDLSNKLARMKGLDHMELFDTVFTMFYDDDELKSKEDVSFHLLNDETDTERYKLRVIVIKWKEACKLKIKYAAELFERSTIRRIAKDYIKILENVVEDKKIHLGELSGTTDISMSHEAFDGIEFDF